MQDSKLVVERTKEWQQQVLKVNEAFSTTNGVLSSVSSVGEDNLAISPKGKRSWAKKCNKWIGILRVLELRLKERFLRKKVCPKVSLVERTSQLTIYQNRKPGVCSYFESVCN